MTDTPVKPESTKPAVRSPSCPAMSLSEALEAVRKIEKLYRLTAVDRGEAGKLVGYAPFSGPANKALADLASYGLVERAGKGELRVTNRATALLYPENDAERRRHLEAAAFEPPLFAQLRERFPGLTPPEGGVANFLNRQGFNASAIKPAMKAYLATLAFLEQSGATESNSTADDNGADSRGSNGGKPTFGGAKVGDLIQWEFNGALQFEKPLRVRAVTDDGEWIFVEGSETGLPMSEVIVEAKASGESKRMAPVLPLTADSPMEKGEIEWMRTPLGQDTKVRLLAQGAMGPKEIGKLIKLLEAQKIVLEDE